MEQDIKDPIKRVKMRAAGSWRKPESNIPCYH